MGVPLAQVLNPYRAMLAVLYPESDAAHRRSCAATSVVYIGARLTFAACSLRSEPGCCGSGTRARNEPRELREGAEAEGIESLVEVAEEPAQTSAAGRSSNGRERSAASSAVGRAFDPGGCGGRRHTRTGTGRHEAGLPGNGERRTTGLHVPRRTHRRIAAQPSGIASRGPIRSSGELMTRAYGAKPLIIKGCYVLLFALGMSFFFYLRRGMENPLWTGLALIPIGLAILSLILVNAQGVTALTSERDTGALDLLLVTELTPKEFIYGKLYGILYNSKEMIALPVITAIAMAFSGCSAARIWCFS